MKNNSTSNKAHTLCNFAITEQLLYKARSVTVEDIHFGADLSSEDTPKNVSVKLIVHTSFQDKVTIEVSIYDYLGLFKNQTLMQQLKPYFGKLIIDENKFKYARLFSFMTIPGSSLNEILSLILTQDKIKAEKEAIKICNFPIEPIQKHLKESIIVNALKVHMELALPLTKYWSNKCAADFVEYIHIRLLYAQCTPHMYLIERFGIPNGLKMLNPKLVLLLDHERQRTKLKKFCKFGLTDQQVLIFMTVKKEHHLRRFLTEENYEESDSDFGSGFMSPPDNVMKDKCFTIHGNCLASKGYKGLFLSEVAKVVGAISFNRDEVLPSIRVCRVPDWSCGAIIVEVPATSVPLLCDNIYSLWSTLEARHKPDIMIFTHNSFAYQDPKVIMEALHIPSNYNSSKDDPYMIFRRKHPMLFRYQSYLSSRECFQRTVIRCHEKFFKIHPKELYRFNNKVSKQEKKLKDCYKYLHTKNHLQSHQDLLHNYVKIHEERDKSPGFWARYRGPMSQDQERRIKEQENIKQMERLMEENASMIGKMERISCEEKEFKALGKRKIRRYLTDLNDFMDGDSYVPQKEEESKSEEDDDEVDVDDDDNDNDDDDDDNTRQENDIEEVEEEEDKEEDDDEQEEVDDGDVSVKVTGYCTLNDGEKKIVEEELKGKIGQPKDI